MRASPRPLTFAWDNGQAFTLYIDAGSRLLTKYELLFPDALTGDAVGAGQADPLPGPQPPPRRPLWRPPGLHRRGRQGGHHRPASETTVHFARAIEELGLEVETLVGVHGTVGSAADLEAALQRGGIEKGK